MNHFFMISNADKDRDLCLTEKMKACVEANGGTAGCFAMFPGEEQKKSLKPKDVPANTECIFVLGGDGTLIRAARDLVSLNIPLIGVNMGTLGYLCELEETTVFDAIKQIMAGRFVIEERMMICGSKGEESAIALNDIVIHMSQSLQIAKLIVYVDGRYLAAYNADGIVIATPTGSTGYSMSAGGPIIEPDANMMLLTPINPHALNAKSIVLSAKDNIAVELGTRRRQKDEEISVSLDGDRTFTLSVGERIAIRQSGLKTKILKLTDQSFLEILQKKMQVYD